MGTNYYWRDGVCVHCGRYEEIHVGKQSAGWSFTFRAWPHQLESADHPEWGHSPSSPFGFPVLSRADWRQVFAERSGRLFDEYDREVEGLPVDWLDTRTPPDAEQIAKEERWMRESYRYVPDTRDPEGFRFYDREFS